MNPLHPWPPLGSIPVIKNPHVPLTSKERDENGVEIAGGVEEPVLYWQIDGAIHVHPDRWDDFERHIAMVNEAYRTVESERGTIIYRVGSILHTDGIE